MTCPGQSHCAGKLRAVLVLSALPLAILALLLGWGVGSARAEDPCYQAVAHGDLDEALRVCSKQLADTQEPPQARAATLNNRGICLLAKGRSQEALQDFNQALILASDFAPAYANRGFALTHLERYQEAIKDFDKALTLLPSSAVIFFNRGYARLMNGEADLAKADFDYSLKLDARYTPALFQRGKAWTVKGRPDKALDDLNKALKQDPQNPEGYTLRGQAWEKLKEPRKALTDFDKALTLNPEQPPALAGRGLAHKKLGNYGQAVADYRRALELDPGQSEAANGLAWLLATCPQEKYRDPAQALALAQKAAEIREDAGRMDTLAAAYAAAGRFAEAVRTQEKAITMIWPGAAAKVKGAYELRLNTYKAKRPWRDDQPKP